MTRLRDLERDSIRAFLDEHSGLFAGKRVLDLGCGKQPYRDLIEAAGGTYYGWDRPTFPGAVVTEPVGEGEVPAVADVVVCTQVLQYTGDPASFLLGARDRIHPGGALLLTGPTNWPVVERDDLFRFTAFGVQRLLVEAGFHEVVVRVRASVFVEGEEWPIGWGAVCRA